MFFYFLHFKCAFNCVCWGGGISKQDRDRLDKIMKKLESVIGKTVWHTLSKMIDKQIDRHTQTEDGL